MILKKIQVLWWEEKMNKKGFTLVELIAVIALLGLLALIALPAVDSALKEGREKLSKTQKKQIVKGAKEFFADNIYCLPGDSDKCQMSGENCIGFEKNNSTTKLPIDCIQSAGYLPSNITDFNKNDEDDDTYVANTYVEVTKSNDTYTYNVVIPENTEDSNE